MMPRISSLINQGAISSESRPHMPHWEGMKLCVFVEGLTVLGQYESQPGRCLSDGEFSIDLISDDLAADSSSFGRVPRQSQGEEDIGTGSQHVSVHRLATGPQIGGFRRRVTHGADPERGSVTLFHRRYGVGVIQHHVVLLAQSDGFQRYCALTRIRYLNPEPKRLGVAGEDARTHLVAIRNDKDWRDGATCGT